MFESVEIQYPSHPGIKHEVDGKVSFKKGKKDIDLDKLENGEYTLDEVVDTDDFKGRLLGEYKDEQVYLKKGKFGNYINYDGKEIPW